MSSKKSASKRKEKLELDTQPEMSQIKIITVTSGNVDKANNLLTKGEAMVEYYHPNCGHCQTLKPEWEKMCYEIKKNYNGKATIAAVDCSDQEMLNRLHIDKSFQGFPTIFHMRDGRSIHEYQGERTKDALLSFAESRLPISMRSQQLKPALPFVVSSIRDRSSANRKKKGSKRAEGTKKARGTRGTKKRSSFKKTIKKKAKELKKRVNKRLAKRRKYSRKSKK